MRFSEVPIYDESATEVRTTSVIPPTPDGRPVSGTRTEVKAGENEKGSPKREEAVRLLQSIGTEFSRLRKTNRSGAWADLEDKIAKSGHVLVPDALSMKDWVGLMIDIEQFRKAESGSAEVPGDALAKWLSEGMEEQAKPKPAKKGKVQ